MKNRIAIIDADGILFAAALKGETSCDGEQLEMRPIEKTYADAMQRIEDQMEAAGCTEAFICLSDRRNFRYDILPTYKGQRAKGTRPLQLDRLRAMISEDCPHRVWLIEGLEADDVAGIAAGTLQKNGRVTVIVSPDKDLLQCPGLLMVPGGKVTEVTQEMADRWHITQTLTGDTCDNYKGCPGWGPVKAGEFHDTLDLAGFSQAEKWAEVVRVYEAAGLTREDCLVQAQVSRILQPTDWDAEAKRPLLWQFPED